MSSMMDIKQLLEDTEYKKVTWDVNSVGEIMCSDGTVWDGQGLISPDRKDYIRSDVELPGLIRAIYHQIASAHVKELVLPEAQKVFENLTRAGKYDLFIASHSFTLAEAFLVEGLMRGYEP